MIARIEVSLFPTSESPIPLLLLSISLRCIRNSAFPTTEIPSVLILSKCMCKCSHKGTSILCHASLPTLKRKYCQKCGFLVNLPPFFMLSATKMERWKDDSIGRMTLTVRPVTKFRFCRYFPLNELRVRDDFSGLRRKYVWSIQEPFVFLLSTF